MIAGTPTSFTSCSALKPFSGYAGDNGNHLTLVRNPNYDQSTDSQRKNYVNTFKFLINSNADDIFNKVQAGQYDDEQSSPQPKTIRRCDPRLLAPALSQPAPKPASDPRCYSD